MSSGQRAGLTDANANTAAFAYDGFERPPTTTFPGDSTEALTYDGSVPAGAPKHRRRCEATGTPMV